MKLLLQTDLTIANRWARLYKTPKSSPKPFSHQCFPPAPLPGKLYMIRHVGLSSLPAVYASTSLLLNL